MAGVTLTTAVDACAQRWALSFKFVAEMPNINYEIKLDFKDVMLRPKRSTLKSRSDVSIDFEFSRFF
jgi:hypothetical protein